MLVTGAFIFLLVIGVPIVFVLGVSGMVHVIQVRMPLVLIPQRMFVGLNSFLILAVPLFILAGNIMNASGITKRLVTFANLLVGRVRGGLAYVTIVASMFFAGITGAGAADTSAVGSIMIPVMKEEGYGADYSAAVTAIGGTIGPIIPPSIAFVIYGAMADVSIASLFLAGFVPGILFGLAQMAVARYYARVRNFPRREIPISLKIFFKGFLDAFLALLMPIVVLGGILTGVCTPTEAAGIGVFYSLVVGLFIYRELKLVQLLKILKDTGVMAGGIMLIVANASLFSWILAAEGVPRIIANWVIGFSKNPYVVLVIINVLLLIVGCIMETLASIIILTPVFLPLIKALGIDPIHFGVIMVVNLCLGLATPPVGVNLFVASGIAKITLEDISKAIWLFIVACLVPLVITTYFPKLILFIPNMVLK